MASAIRKTSRRPKARDVWRECLNDAHFLQENRVSEEDREILSDFSPLGGVKAEADVLFILDTIRWARDKK